MFTKGMITVSQFYQVITRPGPSINCPGLIISGVLIKLIISTLTSLSPPAQSGSSAVQGEEGQSRTMR